MSTLSVGSKKRTSLPAEERPNKQTSIGSTPKSPTLEETFEKIKLGNQALTQKLYQDAKINFETALQFSCPEVDDKCRRLFGEAHYGLGETAYHQDQFEVAGDHYRKAFRIDWRMQSKVNYAFIKLGDSLREKNKPNEAKEYYMQALMTNPSCCDAHVSLGLIAIAQKNIPEAEKHYRAAEQLNILNSPLVPYGLGTIAKVQGKFSEAEKHFREVLCLDPTHELAKTELNQIAQSRAKENPLLSLAQAAAREKR